MATPTLFDTGIFSVIGIASELLIGAKLYWFEAGTSTPAVTYSDPGLTIPNVNPVPANAAGRFPAMWLGDDVFKYVLVAPDGSLASPLVTRDNYTPSGAQLDQFSGLLGGPTGAGLVGFSHDEDYAQGTVGLALQNYISVKNEPYNAVGDGVTDDTAAIQSAIDAAGDNRAILFPNGDYRITSGLTYTGAPGKALTLFAFDKPSRGQKGANIFWDGASGGTMFTITGGNNMLLENLSFDGKNTALTGLLMLPPSSSGISVSSCVFNFFAGAGSAGIRIGVSNLQVSEVKISDCGFQGNFADMDFGIVTASGNVKNFYIERPTINGVDYGISFGQLGSFGASGSMVVTFPVMANIAKADFYMGAGGGELVITGGESEHSTRFIEGPGAVAGPSSITINGYSFQAGNLPADDYVIYNVPCKVVMQGTFLENLRTPTAIPKINVGGLNAGTTAGAFISLGNTYINAAERIPIYDSGNWLLDPGLAPAIHWVAQIISIGDAGGTTSAPVRLNTVTSSMDIASVGVSDFNLASGLAASAQGRVTRTLYTVTVPYTRWNAASTTQALVLGDLIAKTRLVSVIADTTTPYAGLAGTITMKFGTGSGGTQFLLEKDVKTAATQQGILDSELGTLMTRANAVQGGYINWGAQDQLVATLTSGTGNIGNGTTTTLTAGSTTFYIVTETMM